MFYSKSVFRRIGLRMLASGAAVLSSVSLACGQSDSKSATDSKAIADRPIIRVRAGSDQPLKDSKDNVWLPDKESKDGGFVGGDTIQRPDLKIENTKDPNIYRAEHYSMDTFWWKVPNGRYIVKLHFAETYEGIGGPGERVFSYKLHGKEFQDFDVWKKTGGPHRAYVETVAVEVNDGKFKIDFIPKVQNPQINGIEIIPIEKASAEDKAAAEKAKSAAAKN